MVALGKCFKETLRPLNEQQLPVLCREGPGWAPILAFRAPAQPYGSGCPILSHSHLTLQRGCLHSQETCPASCLVMGAASAAVQPPGKPMTVRPPQIPDDVPFSPLPPQDHLRVGFNPSLCDLNPTQRPHLHVSNVPQPPSTSGNHTTGTWGIGHSQPAGKGLRVSGPTSSLSVTGASDTVSTAVAGL